MKRRPPLAKTLSRANKGTRYAVIERLKRRTTGAGSFSAPCIPALYEHYLAKLLQLFDVMDRPLVGGNLENFQRMLRTCIENGFRESPHTRFVLSFRPTESDPAELTYVLSVKTPSLEAQYQEWIAGMSQEHPFGLHPDARVMDVARALGNRQSSVVLDVGAGSGRNSLPLARLGLSVDAMEPVVELQRRLREIADRDHLPVTVLTTDVLLESTALAADRYHLIVMSEVTPHFSRADMQHVFPRLARALAPQGVLLLNAFVAKNGYTPDAVAEQAAQCVWSMFFSARELTALGDDACLELVTNEPCANYEMAHLPQGAWPPTAWYENWASGHNLFAASAGPAPIELCWLEYRRRA